MPVENYYEATLRVALQKSQYTQELVDRLAERNQYARTFTGENLKNEERRLLWRTPEDKIRQEKFNCYFDLFRNKTDVRLRPEWLPTGKTMYKRLNFCRFITNVFADLTLGAGVEICTGNEVIDTYLQDELQIQDRFYNWSRMGSIFGVFGAQVVVDDNGVDVVNVPPDQLYFDFEPCSDFDFRWIAKKLYVDPSRVQLPDKVSEQLRQRKADGIVFEERHYVGAIEYYLYTVAGDEIVEVLDPRWYLDSLPALDENGICRVETNINDFMLQLVPNGMLMREFESDYDDIKDLQASVNVRATQINRILNIHANPKLMLPESMQQKDTYTGEIIVRGLRDEVLFLDPEDYAHKPEYLTWDGQLEQAYKEIEQDIMAICTLAEISPMLIVHANQSFPESAVAYKMKLTPTLNKVKRKSDVMKRALQRLIWVLIVKLFQEGALDTTMAIDPDFNPDSEKVDGQSVSVSHDEAYAPMNVGKFIGDFQPRDISIEFKPSLPHDDRFMVERLAGKQSLSLKTVLEQVDGLSEKQADEEIERIMQDMQGADEAAADMGGLNSFVNESPSQAMDAAPEMLAPPNNQSTQLPPTPLM